MSDVAAFRQLQTSNGYHFIIAGTSNLSGRYFAESVIERAMMRSLDQGLSAGMGGGAEVEEARITFVGIVIILGRVEI